MGLTISDVVSSFGAYIDQGQTAAKVNQAFILPDNALVRLARNIPTQNEVERSVLGTQSRVAQAFKRKWSPLGDTTLKPHTISLFKHKMDVDLYPDDVEKSWLAFMAGPGIKREEWPIGRYIAEVYLLPQYMSDIEMNERVSGVYAAPADDTTPANAGTAMNGLISILDAHITASQITPFATGALSSTPNTFVGQIEDFVESIDPKVRKFIKSVQIPMEQMDIWKTGMQSLYNVNYQSEADIMKVRNQSIRVELVEAQDGTDLIWATTDGNFVRYVKREKNAKAFEMQADKRLLNIFTDHWEGIGFNVPQFVFTNDEPFA